MSNQRSETTLPNSRLSFFKAFLANPTQIASVVPSSRFMERRIVNSAQARSAKILVELGPGTGGTSRALLAAMPGDAVLLTIELNPLLHKQVSRIGDPRHIACLGSAGDLSDILAQLQLGAPNAVVSGIPFSTMRRELGSSIVKQISEVLAPRGRFVAYQLNPRVAELCQPVMGKPKSSTELLNIPPMRVYQWEKS